MSLSTDISSQSRSGSIDNLKSLINRRNGLAKANRFSITMIPPERAIDAARGVERATSSDSSAFNSSNSADDPRDITLLCESCSIPGRQVQTMEHSYFRQTVKRPNGYFNEDITFSFHLTNDYYMKKVFDKWITLSIDPDSYKVNYDAEYKRDIVIEQLNEQNISVYGVKLKNAFPITMNSIDLSNASSDTTQKLSIVITYEDFVPIVGTNEAVSSIKNTDVGTTIPGIL